MKHVVLLFVILMAGCASAQQLARRSFLGIQAEERGGHLIVIDVSPASTADVMGVLAGDELVSLNGQLLNTPAQLIQFQRVVRAGMATQLTIVRRGFRLQKTATAVALPTQSSADFETLYKVVMVGGAPYRAIVTKPKGSGPHPAVFLMGGLGCYSLDPMRNDGPYGHVLNALTRDGFVTMRVDKSGEGDSEGPDCNSDAATVQLAADRSIAGLKLLRGIDFVDRSRVFVFAHSLGPMEGALVVGRVPIRGFIAAETIGRSWFDYQVEIARTQSLLLGQSFLQVEAFTRLNLQCLSLFYLQGLSETDVVKAQPGCRDDLPSQSGMPAAFFRDIAKVNLPEEWKRADIPVLVTYGTSDPLTSSDESKYLVAMINSLHPGRATYLEFDHMSHHFDYQPEQGLALRALQENHNGTYDETFVSRIEQWMRSI